ncbi:NAD kinase [Amorphus orientalis]|uniref:NAD kinase n=1 Tax=Amorphus orientalis TaxID=649198 RepID=A0AAE3VPT2_9HYPH|nr:NAD kinase [Amorphus orientalis]MDQ0315813.1 NAD+ kinase [Amorphus orientalis]
MIQPTALPSIAFVASPSDEAEAARSELIARYGDTPPDDADVIVALGGDGLMLATLHRFMNTGKPIYGMNRGSVGFLMNEYRAEDLHERIAEAVTTAIHPLLMTARDVYGAEHTARAINEVSLLRQTHQAAKLRISIDGRVRLDELICDGILVSTPAGSTAYNLSAHGPILPIYAPLLALTPISAFRPRRWRGALLPNHASVRVEIFEAAKRPVAAAADHQEIRSVVEVEVAEDDHSESLVMFDPDHSWDERILAEQFRY